MTAVFVGIILGATDRRSANVQAPFAIGLALAVLILVAIPVTNASLNPARSTAVGDLLRQLGPRASSGCSGSPRSSVPPWPA